LTASLIKSYIITFMSWRIINISVTSSDIKFTQLHIGFSLGWLHARSMADGSAL
jgi:hypothetical protein